MMILPPVFNGKLWAFLAIVVVAFLVFGVGYTKGLDHQTKEISAISAALATCQANADTLNLSLSRQNEAVAELHAKAVQQQEKYQGEIAKTKLQTAHYYNMAQAILQEKPNQNNDCAAAQALFDAELAKVRGQ